MKRIIKESTTITEMIEDNEGKRFIINRKQSVNVSNEPFDRHQISSELSGVRD